MQVVAVCANQEAIAAQRAEEKRTHEQRIARLEQDLAGAQRHLAAQRTTIGQHETTIAHLADERERQGQALLTAQEEFASVRASRDHLTGRLEDAMTAKEGLTAQLGTAQQQSAEVRAELAAREREAGMLADQLRRTEERTNQLADEKLAWLQERGALMQRAHAAEQQISAFTGSTTSL